MSRAFPRDVELLFQSDYLRECDLQGAEVTVRISGVSVEDLQMADGTKEPAPVLALAKTKKRLVVSSKTNARGIAVLLGRSPQSWIGKRIIVRPEIDPISGMPCIRVCGSPDAAPDRLREWQRAKNGKGGPRQLPMRLLRTLAKIDPPPKGPQKAEPDLPMEEEPEPGPQQVQQEDDDMFGGGIPMDGAEMPQHVPEQAPDEQPDPVAFDGPE